MENNIQYHLNKTEDPYDTIETELKKSRRGYATSYTEDESNAIDIFWRMAQMLGKSIFNNWITSNYETYVHSGVEGVKSGMQPIEEFDNFWFVLQKGLRQGDLFDLRVHRRVKKDFNIEEDN